MVCIGWFERTLDRANRREWRTRQVIDVADGVGGISVRCKTRLQGPASRVRACSQQSCLRRDKIQYFGKVLQNSPLTSHKMRLNRAILPVTLPCQEVPWGTRNRTY